MERPSRQVVKQVAALLGDRPDAWRGVPTGFSPAERWIVTMPDRSTAFVKVATDEHTREAILKEISIYRRLFVPFVPALRAFDDSPERPVIVLEDLSAGQWPPPWEGDRVERVLHTLMALHGIKPLDDLPSLESFRGDLSGWARVAEDPDAFLSLRLVAPEWLDAHLETLRDAEGSAPLDGDALVHFDVRSDNICFRARRTYLVDWNWACRGNPVADIAGWLPSLHAEGGPRPEEILAGHGEIAALVAGYLASKAGLPADTESLARVRPLQRRLLTTALPWAARALGIPEPEPVGRAGYPQAP